MKYPPIQKQLLLLFALLIISIACQEESLVQKEEIDEDMLLATQLADEYLNKTNARTESESSITVLKYENGKLLYNTNTDTIEDYQEITEETVTAFVTNGEHVFWYSGGGVSDLDGIEFDPSSQEQLSSMPEECNPDQMWVISIPEDRKVNTEGYLKYDIIYQFEGHDGNPIRLDPKIKIDQDPEIDPVGGGDEG